MGVNRKARGSMGEQIAVGDVIFGTIADRICSGLDDYLLMEDFVPHLNNRDADILKYVHCEAVGYNSLKFGENLEAALNKKEGKEEKSHA